MEEQVSLFSADTPSGRTSPAHSVQTKGGTSRRSSRSSSGSRNLTLPMFLCLKKESGPSPGVVTTTWGGGAWPGDSTTLSSGAFRSDANGLLWLRTSTDSQPQPYYLTLNIGEKPREPNPTKLSQILEENADPKYRLSAKACQGILNRAERRGKELPKELKEALEEQVAKTNRTPALKESSSCDVTASFMGGQGSKAGGLGYQEEQAPSLKSEASGTNTVPDVIHSIHQNASGEVRESDISYSVSTNQNASGRNTPLVRTEEPIPINDKATRFNGGGETRHNDGAGNGLGVGSPGDPSPTVSTCDRHSVFTSVDCRNGTEHEDVNGTLQSKPNGGFSYNCGIVIREKK